MTRSSLHQIVLGICLIAIAGCGGSDQDSVAKKADGKRTIAVIPKGTMHIFWKSVEAGVRQADDKFENVELIWKGPLREDDRESQIKTVDDMITRGVDGIVLAPLDDTALRASVTEATRSGIPVVIIDSALKGEDYVSFVATENYQGGVQSADALARAMGEKGRVVLLRYLEGSASTTNREDGFLDQIKKYPNIEVVSSNQYAGAGTETAYKASENIINRFNPGDGTLGFDGVFCVNEPGSFGMLRALQDSGFAGKVRFVAFDAGEKQTKALEDGQIDAIVVQRPVQMGFLGVETLLKHLDGEKVPRRIDTGSVVCTKENMNDPETKKLLYPKLAN
jgi:ribose transport system substrate-binding protein